eukprot:TRINITY_DN9097_c0_g1_i1.p1 TRINITY_DN9097_c0_g1~~TRINITY_DN9097_c0_g1_i1.p1  ORF type:complete len:353 (-),score=86.02 TRINITY_DN9097_c0_g1_i1:247-1305(-)
MSALPTARLLALAACLAQLGSSHSPGCGKKTSLVPGQQAERVFQATDTEKVLGQYERRYLIRLPPSYTGEEPIPILFYFHGWCDDWKEPMKFPEVAKHAPFILVKPKGMDDGQKGKISWNVGANGRNDVCEAAKVPDGANYTSCTKLGRDSACNTYTCYDDVQFFLELYKALGEELCFSEEHIFGAGASNGGMFLYYLLAELAKKPAAPQFRGVVPWYGGVLKPLLDVPPALRGKVSVFHMHGVKDTTIPPRGGLSFDAFWYHSVNETQQAYAELNGCGQWRPLNTPFDGRGSLLGCRARPDCQTQVRVVQCLWQEDHGFWPDYAERMTWHFLTRHFEDNHSSQQADALVVV